MLLLNFCFFVISVTVLILLVNFFRKLYKPADTPICKFKFSKVKYFCSHNNRKYAKFHIRVNKINKYFIDFPVQFRFYSDQRFKSKIKISYSTLNDDGAEEIMNKVIYFETKTKEHKHYINDIIIGKIEIEIELINEYGNPIIEFEILKNDMCVLMENYKKIIKFPE